jgi:DNA repair protein RecN (Recombination protein N)
MQMKKNLDEIIEFTKFEIDKIASIDPKVDELNDLKDFKDKLSKKDKLDIYLQNAKPVLDDSHHITALLNNLDVDSSFFEDALNEVEIVIDKYNASFEFVDDDEIEKILTRIEDLTKLERKYGSIEEAISYKQEKEIELEKLDNITFEKAILEKNISKLEKIVNDLASQISKFRSSNISILEEKINHYLELLYLNNLQINLEPKTLSMNGTDSIEFTLNSTALKSISSGEFNRLRLALLTARSEFEISHKGILFLDEIDANLSGKESAAIAKVLKQLSKHYQIFAISHQPQLSSCANQHFLVYKEDSISKVKELDHDGKVQEIARIISGDHITSEAKEFAQTLLEKNK